MKEQYLSKTPFLTFVYISKCNINLPGYFGNSKKKFLWTGLVCTIYAWIWQLRWNCAFYFGQRHSINKEENSLSKNSFGLIRKLNCDRLAAVQFLAYRQSVSLFLESNYSQIIAKDQKLDQEIHRLKCRRKFSFVFHSHTKRNKSSRKPMMNGFFPHNLHYRKIQEKA